MDIFSLTTPPDDDTETPEEQNEFDILEEVTTNLVENLEGKHGTEHPTASQPESDALDYCTSMSSDRLCHFECDLNEASTLQSLNHSVSPPLRTRYGARIFICIVIVT